MCALLREIGDLRNGSTRQYRGYFFACAVACAYPPSVARSTIPGKLVAQQTSAAADAASVGSVAKTSPAFIAAGTMTSDGAIAAGVTDAQNIFDANMTGGQATHLTPLLQR